MDSQISQFLAQQKQQSYGARGFVPAAGFVRPGLIGHRPPNLMTLGVPPGFPLPPAGAFVNRPRFNPPGFPMNENRHLNPGLCGEMPLGFGNEGRKMGAEGPPFGKQNIEFEGNPRFGGTEGCPRFGSPGSDRQLRGRGGFVGEGEQSFGEEGETDAGFGVSRQPGFGAGRGRGFDSDGRRRPGFEGEGRPGFDQPPPGFRADRKPGFGEENQNYGNEGRFPGERFSNENRPGMRKDSNFSNDGQQGFRNFNEPPQETDRFGGKQSKPKESRSRFGEKRESRFSDIEPHELDPGNKSDNFRPQNFSSERGSYKHGQNIDVEEEPISTNYDGSLHDYMQEQRHDSPRGRDDKYRDREDRGRDRERSSNERSRERDRDRRRERDQDRERERDHPRGRGDRDRDRSSSRDRRERSRFEEDRGGYSGFGEERSGYDAASNTREKILEHWANLDKKQDQGGYDRHDRDSSTYEQGSGYDRGGEKWTTDTPTNTVMLRGLPSQIEEKDIRAELMLFGAPIKDVRVMKKKTGVSRGFAFVEFQTTTDAQRWMDQNQSQLYMLNQYRIAMLYCQPKTGGNFENRGERFGGNRSNQDLDPSKTLTDWICSKCGVHNFKRREHCFKCYVSREESEKAKEGDGYDQVGTNPCNTLIFRGLDALTTEENINNSLCRITALTIKNVKVMRDTVTGVSQGYAFVEMSSIQEAGQLMGTLLKLNPPLEVDGKQMVVSYSKNTYATVLATLSQTSTSDQYSGNNWGEYNQSDYSAYYQGTSYQVAPAAATATVTAATTPTTEQTGYYDSNGQYYDYSQYYQQQAAGTGSTQSDSTNAAAAVAQAAIQQAQAVKNIQKQQEQYQKQVLAQIQQQAIVEQDHLAQEAQQWTTVKQDGSAVATPQAGQTQITGQPGPDGQWQTYPVPDVSTYQYDESSGYYYDPLTTLYYDANSQYYYNAQSGNFLYWDSERSTYLPAPTDQQKTDEDKKDKDNKQEKVKIAKKVAKDMEKWAKTLNAQKEKVKKSWTALGARNQDRESASADAGFAVMEKARNKPEDLMPPPPAPGGASKPADTRQGLVASYGGDSDEEEDEDQAADVDESKFTDYTKMACLLCKRQFPNKEALQRHQQLSDLHKQNLESIRQSRGGGGATSEAGGSQSMQYRDRAKERRQKYGTTGPPVKKKQNYAAQPPSFEQPNNQGLRQDNIGNKLLQKMGWNEGQGLGRSNQGRADPITAERRAAGAGLGARGSNYGAAAGDTYKDSVRKSMYARYKDLD